MKRMKKNDKKTKAIIIIIAICLLGLEVYFIYSRTNNKLNELLDNVSKIKNIPITIVHNRIDMITPLEGAWDLHLALPQSKLIIVDDLGHGTPKQMAIVKQIVNNI